MVFLVEKDKPQAKCQLLFDGQVLNLKLLQNEICEKLHDNKTRLKAQNPPKYSWRFTNAQNKNMKSIRDLNMFFNLGILINFRAHHQPLKVSWYHFAAMVLQEAWMTNLMKPPVSFHTSAINLILLTNYQFENHFIRNLIWLTKIRVETMR